MPSVLVIGEKTSQVKKFVSVLLNSRKVNQEGKMVYSYSGFWNDGNITFDLCFLPLVGHISSIDTGKGYGWKDVSPITIVSDRKALFIKYKPKYTAIIKRLAVRADQIWLATDPDSEGDNIADEALNIALRGNSSLINNVFRIWNSSLTKKEIIRAFQNRLFYDNKLALAVQGRRYADAWMGFAATREITLAARKVIKLKVMSVGRVQLPTLKKITERDAKIDNFVPVNKWNLNAALEKNGKDFKAEHEANPFKKEKKAAGILESLKNEKEAFITGLKRTEVRILPPIPLNTTAALGLITNQLKITADSALSTMEELYLAGCLSYPRTDNTCFKDGFPHDVILNKLTSDVVLNGLVKQVKVKTRVRRNGKKMGTEDHDPLHPTGEFPTNQTERATKTWNLITRHYIGLFMDDHIVSKTRASIMIGNELFISRGNITKSPGWTQAINWKKTREKILPELVKGESVFIKRLFLEMITTKPLPRWSDAKLLKEMEKLKIGTKSSRPDILNKLVQRRYVKRVKTSLESTQQGKILINVLSPIWPDVVGPTFTRKVEERMDQVALGKKKYGNMLEELRNEYLALHQLLLNRIPELQQKLGELGLPNAFKGDSKKSSPSRQTKSGKKCPNCGSPLVIRKNKKTNETFYGCQSFPKCRHTEPYVKPAVKRRKDHVKAAVMKKKKNSSNNDNITKCPRCGSNLTARINRKSGEKFIGCTNFPKCTFTCKTKL